MRKIQLIKNSLIICLLLLLGNVPNVYGQLWKSTPTQIVQWLHDDGCTKLGGSETGGCPNNVTTNLGVTVKANISGTQIGVGSGPNMGLNKTSTFTTMTVGMTTSGGATGFVVGNVNNALDSAAAKTQGQYIFSTITIPAGTNLKFANIRVNKPNSNVTQYWADSGFKMFVDVLDATNTPTNIVRTTEVTTNTSTGGTMDLTNSTAGNNYILLDFRKLNNLLIINKKAAYLFGKVTDIQ